MEFTPEEKLCMSNLLKQVTVSPSAKDAIDVIKIVQALLEKLK